jgi:hypothetical protein
MSKYSTIPVRENSLTLDIENLKLLQDEQIRLTAYETRILMYYISGGNEEYGGTVPDAVREEDQDLRGWFAEHYGENYLSYLTSDTQALLTSKDKIAKIRSDFELNPYGYILRTGAVNDYHLGRIVSHAAAINKHRNAALQHSGDLVTKCGKLLLEGKIPTPSLFSTLHSSISNWYSLKGITTEFLMLDKHLSAHNLTNKNSSINHTTYLVQVVMALMDVHKASMPVDTWHNYEVPNAKVNAITAEDIKNMIEATDGVEVNAETLANIGSLRSQLARLAGEIELAENAGWNVKPKITKEIQDGFKSWSELSPTLTTPEFRMMYAEYGSLPIGAEVPRGAKYRTSSGGFVKGYKVHETSDLYINYDKYKMLLQSKFNLEQLSTIKQAEVDASLSEGAKVKDFHLTPSAKIWAALTVQEDGVMTNYKTRWVKYIFARVKQAYGLKYATKSLELAPGSYSPYPVLHIPHTYNGEIGDPLNYIDVSKLIQFYGQAYLGGTPTAYWSKNLSYRIFIKKNEGNAAIAQHTEIYLYDANIKTGGIGSTNVLIGKATTEVESAKGIIGAFLPDIPLYNPGVNTSLTSELTQSFSDKVLHTPSLQSWLNNGNKDPFHYAYVINSSWDPLHGEKLKKRWATYLLGGVPRKYWEDISSSNPAFANTHIDWVRANQWSKSKFKGIGVFSPSLSTLRYDPIGNYQNIPEFYEADGTIAATEMKCIAFPKAASEKIVEFMNTVPGRISKILNSVTKESNSAWSGTTHDFLNNWQKMGMANGWSAAESDWPEVPLKQFARSPGSRSAPKYFYDKQTLMALLRPMGTFLENKTETLFIKDPRNAMTKAYNRLITTKPGFGENPISANYPHHGGGLPSLLLENETEGSHLYRYTQCFDIEDFGEEYSDYMALLGTIAYFNSYHLLTDPHKTQRTYPEWCKPFKGKINSLVDSVVGSYSGSTIYSSQINDTEDVSIMHRVLKELGAFNAMTEMPVFDVPEFHIRWLSVGLQESKMIDNPFVNGYPLVPVGGLEAQAFLGLNKTYGDVFYNAILNTAVLQPVFKQPTANYYMYSSLRVPVNAIGVSSKTYGMRPGVAYSFDTVSQTQSFTKMLTSSSGRITYTALGGVAGVAFMGLLGLTMYRNINNEGAFADVRFKAD